MVLSAIKSVIPKPATTTPKVVNNTTTQQTQTTTNQTFTKSGFKSTGNGILFGICAGIGDGFATVYSARSSAKKAVEEYKNYSFAEKKSAIAGLHAKGVNVKEYKEYIKGLHNLSMPKVMAKRALIYGTAIGLFGLAIDTYRHYKDLKEVNKS